MLKQQLQQKLQQKLSPQQIQLIRLLELPAIELEERVKHELEDNPALEEGKEPVDDFERTESEEGGEEIPSVDTETDLSLGDYLTEDDIPDYKLREMTERAERKEDVPFSVYELSKEDDMIDLEYARHEDKDVFFKVFYASENFLSVMDIQVEEGRDFTREDLNKAQSDYIINPAAERDFHLHPGDRFNDRTVLGVSKDFRFNSCRIASSPFVFALNNDIPNPKLVSYIRFNSKTNLQEAVAHVRETLKEIDPTFPFEISFYNTILNNLYQKEQTLGKLISLFGIMAILISIVGVFGLVLFETQYRRKEIGIRKINGATTGQILLMFNKTYIRIVSVCFIISIPIAWMGTQQWLENFAYKTPLHLWVFIVAFLIILSVTIGTVTFRNWQAANENPVNSVKSE